MLTDGVASLTTELPNAIRLQCSLYRDNSFVVILPLRVVLVVRGPDHSGQSLTLDIRTDSSHYCCFGSRSLIVPSFFLFLLCLSWLSCVAGPEHPGYV